MKIYPSPSSRESRPKSKSKQLGLFVSSPGGRWTVYREEGRQENHGCYLVEPTRALKHWGRRQEVRDVRSSVRYRRAWSHFLHLTGGSLPGLSCRQWKHLPLTVPGTHRQSPALFFQTPFLVSHFLLYKKPSPFMNFIQVFRILIHYLLIFITFIVKEVTLQAPY